MRVSELFAGERVAVTGEDVEVGALAFDSRRVGPGALFAALVGATSDGHDHVPAAVARGAVCVLCERPTDTGSATRVVVRNSRLALARAARRFYGDPAAELTLVGVTGTNGKTTIVHLLEAMLEAAGERPGIVGTLGTRFSGHETETGMTTPESSDLVALLRRMRDVGTTAVAMEVSSHALAQERVAGVDYDAAVFTNLTHDHLDYHGTLDAYFAAKRRLFFERLKPGAKSALNLDDPRVAGLARELPPGRVVGFSTDAAVDAAAVRPLELRLSGEGMWARLALGGGTLEVRSPLVGRFNLANVLGAIAAASALGLPPEAIRGGVAAVASVPGRLERVSGAGAPLVLVDYAHTPDALAKALAAVREVTRGRLLCVFGCGGDRDAYKRPLMGQVVAREADWAVLTSDNPRTEDPRAIAEAVLRGLEAAGSRPAAAPGSGGYHLELDRAAAIRLAVAAAEPGDSVLIAGKGHETYQIVGAVKHPFDDRAQGRAALAAAGFATEHAATWPSAEDSHD